MEQDHSNSNQQTDNQSKSQKTKIDKSKFRVYLHDEIMAGKAVSKKRRTRNGRNKYVISAKLNDGTELVLILYENGTEYPTSIMSGVCLTLKEMKSIKRDKRRLP